MTKRVAEMTEAQRDAYQLAMRERYARNKAAGTPDTTAEQRRAASALQRSRHPQRNRDYQRAYKERVLEKNPLALADKNREWRGKNPSGARQHALTQWGLTVAQFDELYDGQGGKCLVCSSAIERTGKGRHIDHCHATNKIRGILCSRCNLGLGYFRDNPEIIRNAAAYLERPDTGLVVRKPERCTRRSGVSRNRERIAERKRLMIERLVDERVAALKGAA